MSPEATIQQIRDLIILMIIGSLTDHQHYPSMRKIGDTINIGVEGAPDLSVSLRDVAYETVYLGLFSAGAYHLRMIDGALIQMMYSFDRTGLRSHRLCYFPSPALSSYDEAAQLYEEEELYADIFSTNTVRSPLRFDFSASAEKYVDIEHPKSHFTIGQYKSCRIPVDGPLTPFRFMRFVLRNFYNSAYQSVNIDARANLNRFDSSISDQERNIFHVVG